MRHTQLRALSEAVDRTGSRKGQTSFQIPGLELLLAVPLPEHERTARLIDLPREADRFGIDRVRVDVRLELPGRSRVTRPVCRLDRLPLDARLPFARELPDRVWPDRSPARAADRDHRVHPCHRA